MYPNWDFFIIIFILTLVTYSFFIGRKQLLKMIFSCYISALASDGAGNLFGKYILSIPELSDLNSEKYIYIGIFIKIIIFIVLLVILSLHSGLEIEVEDSESSFVNGISTAILGLLCATLITSITVAYYTGGGFVFSDQKDLGLLDDIIKESRLLLFFTYYNSLTFLIPVAFFIISSVQKK